MVANIAIIEKGPSEKEPIAMGRFVAHKNPNLAKYPFGGILNSVGFLWAANRPIASESFSEGSFNNCNICNY